MYRERMPRRFGDRAPRVEQRGQQEVLILPDAEKLPSGLLAAAGQAYEDVELVMQRFDQGRQGGFDPHARIKDQDLDGVAAEVLFGDDGGGALRSSDLDLRLALMQAYNDWLADFCRVYPERLVGIAELPFWDVDLALREAQRVRASGLRGVLMPAIPTTHAYNEDWYEPLWDVLEDLEMPVNMHLAGPPATRGLHTDSMAWITTNKLQMCEPITSMITSGALERHPKLQLVSVESMVGWMAWLVAHMDSIYEKQRHVLPMPITEVPSFYFRRQIHATFVEDPLGIRERHTVGIGCPLWSSDYPHSISSFGRSQELIERDFKGVPEAERDQIICGNAARLYGLAG
jgi:predicted TIM-barrel fold metal-dependent hydrolase